MKNELKITSPNKILFPKDNIKKMDVISYYIDICSLMLPFVENRILSVIRCHDGINGECFFKKHPTNDTEINIINDKGEEYFYLSNKPQLIHQVQNGTMEFHIGGSSINKINKPNMMVFDLDPDSKLPLQTLRDAVLKVKSVLDELNLQSFLKISGGKGYHIVLPFKDSKNWESFYDFSRQVALIIENKWPKFFTTNIKKEKRKGKIFIDYLRNNRGSTCVAPYSIRARETAPISMPIAWEDLNKIKPNEVTIKNYKQYINKAWNNFFETNQKFK